MVVKMSSPQHYNGDWRIGDFITDQNLSFYEGSIVKYVCRYRKKDGIKDLDKIIEYANKLKEVYFKEDSNGV
jgi:hypothetical protein